jgi:hypothetical protein
MVTAWCERKPGAINLLPPDSFAAVVEYDKRMRLNGGPRVFTELKRGEK